MLCNYLQNVAAITYIFVLQLSTFLFYNKQASACPGCGCPVEEFEQEEQQKAARELPPEERPEMMECVKCGRPLPIGIEKCIYCNQLYDHEEYVTTGILHLFAGKCPKCGGGKIRKEDKVPIFRKISDYICFGGVVPTTKQEFNDEVFYTCKSCGYRWRQKN